MRKVLILTSLLLLYTGVGAQVISGRVTDEENKPLVLCNVMVLNHNLGTSTNENGEFVLKNLSKGKYQIQFSFLGYKTKTIQVKSDTSKTIFLNIKLKKAAFQSDEIVVTATKTKYPISKIPVAMEYISTDKLKIIPAQTIDQIMQYSSGITVDRPFGIFGKSVVGMRGVVSNEPGRQLTLIDGVPINKSDGGTINWNRIILSDIEHIEIQKGPSSSMYGNNAMAGIINIITKRPYKKGVFVNAKTYFGSYHTYGAEFNFMQKFGKNIKGFYYVISGKKLKSNGYITVPDSIRNEFDVATFVNENALNSRFGYKYNYNTNIEFEYNYYNDRRGQGIKIKQNEGMTADHDTHFAKAHIKAKTAFVNWDINAYFQLEKYKKIIEKLKRGNYTLINVNSDRMDYGIILGGNTRYKNNIFTYGFDFNKGSVDAADNYKTSTDIVVNKGIMETYNLYLQDNISFYNDKFKALISLNCAFANFDSGIFDIKNPTSNTDFMIPYAKKLNSKKWVGYNPKLALQYNINEFTNTYISVSNGFRTANLDDLTRSGFINIGYKIANPDLKPETINNYELGIRYNKQNVFFKLNGYFSKGHNFMYYLATGDVLFGGRKKVYKKENISEVEIYGVETGIKYFLNKNINLSFNYTYNHSLIQSFEGNEKLVGNVLTYSPVDLVNFGVLYKKKKLISSVYLNFKSKQYISEDNHLSIPSFITFDTFIKYKFYKNLGLGLTIQNILNKTYMVSSDQISLGRFFTFELNYKL